MDNNKHTARYQLSRFLQSQESFNLSLDGKDIAILVTIFDFMDSGTEEQCFANQTLISKISRVPRRTLIRSIQHLIKLGLIEKTKVGYKNYYFIGQIIKKYVPGWHIVSAKSVKSKCHGGTLYNNNNNNSYKKGAAQKDHDQKPFCSVECQTTSMINITEKRQEKGSPLLQEIMNKTVKYLS